MGMTTLNPLDRRAEAVWSTLKRPLKSSGSLAFRTLQAAITVSVGLNPREGSGFGSRSQNAVEEDVG